MKNEYLYLPALSHDDLVLISHFASQCGKDARATALGEWTSLLVDDELTRRSQPTDGIPREFLPFDPPLFGRYDTGRALSMVSTALDCNPANGLRKFLEYIDLNLTCLAVAHLCESKPMTTSETKLCRT